jgi:hypothetical protein
VNEEDRDKVDFSGGVVSLKPEATGSVLLRYNVVAVDGLFGGGCAELGVRFRDNGPEARIIVRLKRYNLVNGETTTLLTLNSDNFDASDSFQLKTVVDFLHFDFFNFAYFLEASLRKTDATGSPALAIIQLASVLC